MPDDRLRVAEADAWEAEGRLRERFGGGACVLPGVRLMASGLPHAQWNAGIVHDVARLDIAAVAAWYATRAFGAGVPWGLLVPAEQTLEHGRRLHARRCMGLVAERFAAAPPPSGVALAAAAPADLERVVRIDAEAFGSDAVILRDWVAPHFDAPDCTVAMATRAGIAVGVATGLRTRGEAGPSLAIYGLAVQESERGRGIGAALVSWLVACAFAGGATLAHLNPDTDAAARLYARLGFVEAPGFDIYAGCDVPRKDLSG